MKKKPPHIRLNLVLKKNYLTLLGIATGTITALLYLRNYGYFSHHSVVPIKPFHSLLYSSLYFALLFNLFRKKDRK